MTRSFRDTLPTYCDPIFIDYRPYNDLPAFWEGFEASGFNGSSFNNPHVDVAAQAWDRGREARARCNRMLQLLGL